MWSGNPRRACSSMTSSTASLNALSARFSSGSRRTLLEAFFICHHSARSACHDTQHSFYGASRPSQTQLLVGVLLELSNRYQESTIGRYSAKKFLIERPKRRRTTGSGTSCPPFSIRSLTLDNAISTLSLKERKKYGLCTPAP